MTKHKQTCWKPLPVSLKILFVLLILWVFGSVMGVPMRYTEGLPLMGIWVTGYVAFIVVLLLDILGPIALLVAIWQRSAWGPKIAYIYMGAFLLNTLFAVFVFQERLGGVLPMLVPALVTIVFLVIIIGNRDFFTKNVTKKYV